jgi:hypothetical protein
LVNTSTATHFHIPEDIGLNNAAVGGKNLAMIKTKGKLATLVTNVTKLTWVKKITMVTSANLITK